MKLERVATGTGVCIALAWATPAFAYRPFDGTDADVAAPHEVELEVGPVGYEREGSAHFLVTPALVLNYGLAPRLEAVLEGRQQWALRNTNGSALEDVALSLKSLMREGSLQDRTGVSVALETGLVLPGSERRFGLHLASIFSWRWPVLTVHLNLGNDLLTSLDYAAAASVILEGPDGWLVRPVGELLLEREFGQAPFRAGLSRSVLVGAIANWNDDWAFDLGLRHGRTDDVLRDEARLGFTWAFDVR